MHTQPLVTIISPCYNHQQYIIESLDSIKKQTYKNIRHIIIDDCSTDSSVDLIEEWIENNNYPCEFIKHTRNTGIANTLNESIELTNGEYWSPLATDDYILPTRTEELLNTLINSPDHSVVVSDSKFVNEHSEEIELDGYNSFTRHALRERENIKFNTNNYGSFSSLLEGNYLASSVMARTAALREVGMFKKNCRIEDWDMWLRLAQKKRFLYIDRQLTFYRIHPKNTITTDKNIPLDALKTILDQKYFCYRNGYREKFETLVLRQWYIALYERKYKFMLEIIKVLPIVRLLKFTLFNFLKKPKPR